jgi:hypothetical protein
MVSVIATIVVVYLTGVMGRAAVRRFTSGADATRQVESLMASALETAATAVFVVFKWRVIPHVWVPAAWAATGAALVAAGYWRSRPEQRWQGYALGIVGGMASAEPLWRNGAASPTVLLVAATVTALLYAVAAGSREASRRTNTHDIDAMFVFASSLVASILLAALERRAVPEVTVALTWAATAAVMLTIGFWRQSAADLRGLAYALLSVSGMWQMVIVLDAQFNNWLPWALVEAGVVYAVATAIRAPLARMGPDRSAVFEETTRRALLVGATFLLTTIVFQWVPRGVIVPAWGLEGMGLLVGGLLLRERVLRLSGLSLLLLCLVRLGYDVRTLDALGRIVAFVVLGLVLLSVSWVYTRFKDQIRQWL